MLDAASARELREPRIQELPAPAAANPFPGDVPNNYVHLNNIKRLSQAGIVNGNPGTAEQPNGIGATRYGPDLFVTRSQMASFINRAVAFATFGNPANAGRSAGFQAQNAEFYVDPQQEVHEDNVNGITSAGIAQGVGGKRYDGLGNVTRQQMARFLARTLSVFFTPEAKQPAAGRILGVNNALSANFPDGDRDTATRVGNNTGAAATPLNSRTFTATGLQVGVEYRLTVVDAGQVTQATTAGPVTDVRFATRAEGSGFLVATGTSSATIVSVNGALPVNNTAAGTATTPAPPRTAVAEANAQGVLTFTLTGAIGANVVVAIYRNGGGDQSSLATGGGANPLLEVDRDGRPIEQFGVTGETRFEAGFQMTVHTHSDRPETLLFPNVDRLSFNFTEGEKFAYSSRFCRGNAPFNDVGLDFKPNFPGVDDDADGTAAVRHKVEGTVTKVNGDRGTIVGTITTVLCVIRADGVKIESDNVIVTNFTADSRRLSNNEQGLTGTFEISPILSTGTFKGLQGQGSIEASFVCLGNQRDPSQPTCATGGEFTDFVAFRGDPRAPAGVLKPGLLGSFVKPV